MAAVNHEPEEVTPNQEDFINPLDESVNVKPYTTAGMAASPEDLYGNREYTYRQFELARGVGPNVGIASKVPDGMG